MIYQCKCGHMKKSVKLKVILEILKKLIAVYKYSLRTNTLKFFASRCVTSLDLEWKERKTITVNNETHNQFLFNLRLFEKNICKKNRCYCI